MAKDLEIVIQGDPEKVAAAKKELIEALRAEGIEPEEEDTEE